MFDRKKTLRKWEKTRKVGIWKYVIGRTLIAAVVSFVTFLLFSLLLQTDLKLPEYIIESLLIGFSVVLTAWISSEVRYKRFKQNK